MGVNGTPRSFYKKFAFQIQIDGIDYFGFSKCSELSFEIAESTHWEGGRRIPHKSVARITFPDITLEQGATKDRSLYEWAKECANAAANSGLVDDQYKRNLTLVQQDLDQSALKRWNIMAAFVKKFVAGDWDNNSDDVVIQSVTLGYDLWEEA